MLFILCMLQEPVAGCVCIGHGFLRGKGFRSDQEKCFFGIYLFQCFSNMCRINIRNKIGLDLILPIGFQGFCYHKRSQITAPDTYIYDVAYLLTGIAFPFTFMDLFTKVFICSLTRVTAGITSSPFE